MPANNLLKDIRYLVWTALLAALIAVSSFIMIPIPFVPITLQTMLVLLAGFILGPYYGSISVFIYIGAGFIGLPVFAGGKSGIAVAFGPTGGYLLSFILMAYLAGMFRFSYKKRIFIWCLFLSLSITMLNLIIGSSWLIFINNWTLIEGFWVGIVPFIPGGIVKAFLACIIFYHFYKHNLLPK